jgi:hypothetical protein
MTDLNALRTPLSFLQSTLQEIPHREVLEAEENWWKSEGVAISHASCRFFLTPHAPIRWTLRL